MAKEKTLCIRKRVFSRWFDHGQNPKNANYEYIVVPGTAKSELIKYAKDPLIQILRNSKHVQSVRHSRGQLMGIVFYEKGALVMEELKISADNPCIILLKETVKTVFNCDPICKIPQN